MMGPRPRAPCMLGKCSIKGAAPSPQPMCICFEGWRRNIQCLLRWKMKVGNISDFFALGNYDFGTWDIHGVLQKILLSCSGSVLQADVNRKFTPSTSEGFTQALSIQDTPSAQVSPLQAPLHRLQRELGEGVTLQAQWPSEIKHLDFGTSCAWSTPGLRCPSMGTTEEKTLGIDERKNPWLEWMAFFCENGFKTQVLNPATTSSKRPHSRPTFCKQASKQDQPAGGRVRWQPRKAADNSQPWSVQEPSVALGWCGSVHHILLHLERKERQLSY